jgi:hypothetical protein
MRSDLITSCVATLGSPVLSCVQPSRLCLLRCRTGFPVAISTKHGATFHSATLDETATSSWKKSSASRHSLLQLSSNRGVLLALPHGAPQGRSPSPLNHQVSHETEEDTPPVTGALEPLEPPLLASAWRAGWRA